MAECNTDCSIDIFPVTTINFSSLKPLENFIAEIVEIESVVSAVPFQPFQRSFELQADHHL